MSNQRPPSSGDHLGEDTERPISDFDAPTQAGTPISEFDQATIAPGESSASKSAHGTGRDSDSSLVGTQFGDYEILGEIARGGMGVIYEARQRSLNRVVALKMILSGQFASEDEIRRFNSESTAAAQLDHPHIVPIYDSGVLGENHYFSMKLIEGEDLSRSMPRLRSDLKSGVLLLEKICRAIHHAHQRGILHRDLKPANILLDADGEPYLTDLGLARHVGSDNQLTRTGAVVGTPSYMPPEQATGSADITTAVDIYSLGAILYEMLAGRPPFQSDNVMATLMQVINESPERPSMSGVTDRNLEMIALKCLSKSPTERYPTAAALADDLQRWLNGEPVSVRAPSFAVVARNWLRQNFGHAIWILIIGVASGMIAGWGVWFATVQTEMGDILSVYEAMPSVDAPLTIASWSTPSWAVIPCMVAFTSAVMFIGYLTAALARTKNRSADLAAGIMVGVISAGAAFFVCFGTLCVVAMGFGNVDVELLAGISNVPEGVVTPELQRLLDEYPELETLNRGEQVQLILRKIEADRLYEARNGILLGTLTCLILFLSAGIVETLLAGPIIRASPNLGVAMAQYVFRSYPFVVTTVIAGVHAAGFVILGHTGIIWNWLPVVTFAVLALGMFAELKQWHWWIRLPLVLTIGVLFAVFFAYSFSMLPTVAQSSVEVRKRLTLAERHPNNIRMKNRAVNSIQTAGVRLFRSGFFSHADRRFIQALNYLDEIPRETWTPDLKQQWRVAILNRVNALEGMNRAADSNVLIDETLSRWPDDCRLRTELIVYHWRRDRMARGDELFSGLFISSQDDWTALKDLFHEAKPNASTDEVRQGLSEVLTRSPLDDSVRSRLSESLEVDQVWNLCIPADPEQSQMLQEQLTRVKDAGQLKQLGDLSPDWRRVKTLGFRGVDLTKFVEGQEGTQVCYAIAVVSVPRAQPVTLSLGSDDSASVWLNGELLQESSGIGRAFLAREDQVECQLESGQNLVLLRIDQFGGEWKFALELEDENGWPISVEWDSLALAED